MGHIIHYKRFVVNSVTTLIIRLEPRAVKVARVVLRGERTREGPNLPDTAAQPQTSSFGS